jgi:hypothetical protein
MMVVNVGFVMVPGIWSHCPRAALLGAVDAVCLWGLHARREAV